MLNKNYLNLDNNYLFSTIASKVRDYKIQNPQKKVISLGIGDVTLPLVPEVIEAMKNASDEMGNEKTFHGYGDEQGYTFLREEINKYYNNKNVNLEISEIFISDGAKSDLGNILDIFDENQKVLIPDPVYPVYVDTNVMDSRSISFTSGSSENNFLPNPPEEKYDIIYICSPNNPTGSVYTFDKLKQWVEYANENNSIILFDAAYEAFITENVPSSIYQIDGAKNCAIEFCSFSKTAGFTGVRCGYTIVPNELKRDNISVNSLWKRRQTTKFNGVGYIVQKGASAIFNNGKLLPRVKSNIEQYLSNAQLIKKYLNENKIWNTGGKNSPYIWFMIPDRFSDSWKFFNYLLENFQIVGTPGSGFGKSGERFFRFTAFSSNENIKKAVLRLAENMDN